MTELHGALQGSRHLGNLGLFDTFQLFGYARHNYMDIVPTQLRTTINMEGWPKQQTDPVLLGTTLSGFCSRKQLEAIHFNADCTEICDGQDTCVRLAKCALRKMPHSQPPVLAAQRKKPGGRFRQTLRSIWGIDLARLGLKMAEKSGLPNRYCRWL